MQQGDIEKPTLAPASLYPVTLPMSEAFQNIPVLLAEMAPTKKKMVTLLRGIQFTLKESSLVFVPFIDRGSEFVWPQGAMAINKNALRVGKGL